LITGDVHGCWRDLNSLVNKKSPNIVLCCGDFGWWPKENRKPVITWNEGLGISRTKKFFNAYGVKTGKAKVYWCDGNHEDHESLKQLLKETEVRPVEVMDNVFYMERGSVLTLPDGRKVLFIGGAESIDKCDRIAGRDWFPEEIITQRDVYNLPECDIDIVVSHTCPEEFYDGVIEKKSGVYFSQEKLMDPSRIALSVVLDKYKPKQWFFGHFHVGMRGICKETNTRWTCLNMSNATNWWAWLT